MDRKSAREYEDEALIGALGRAAREVADAAADGGPAPAAWHRLREARARGEAAAPRRPWIFVGIVFAGAAALAIVFGARVLRRPVDLTYVVSGGEALDNGYVRAAETVSDVRFSDGTAIHLERGARVSVGAPGPHGARVVVDDGQAHFDVRHLPGAQWSVEAGPYRVDVTGTVFDVRWSGADETAVVTMFSGSVLVSGPHLAAPLRLVGGQRLSARVALGEVHIEDTTRATAPRATVTPAPTPPSVPAVVTPPAPRLRRAPSIDPEATTRAHALRWSHDVAAGDATAVLADARARGLDDVLTTVDDDALAALADAARYAGARDVATRALETLRRRYPTSPRAPASAFLLGRLADDGGATGAALDWYRRALAEAPRGSYAAEALGREMLDIERLSGRDAAAPLAHDYLARFPDGPYLLQARAILGLP
ncbi:MAG TPA: FecR domain-containing protein [Polyangia bacterium]|nr:FecR domain-containing protein [Polyangia bacterium]